MPCGRGKAGQEDWTSRLLTASFFPGLLGSWSPGHREGVGTPAATPRCPDGDSDGDGCSVLVCLIFLFNPHPACPSLM